MTGESAYQHLPGLSLPASNVKFLEKLILFHSSNYSFVPMLAVDSTV